MTDTKRVESEPAATEPEKRASGPRHAAPRRSLARRRPVLTLGLAGALLVAILAAVLLPTWGTGSGKGPVPSAHEGSARAPSQKTTGHVTTTTLPPSPLTSFRASAATPLVVLDIGDSLGIDLGQQLQNNLDATGVAQVAMDSVGDSGLDDVAFYNWPAQVAAELASVHPQLLVVFLGANDGQGMDVNGSAAQFGDPTWTTAYAQRVDTVLQEAAAAHAAVAWVGMPAMQDPTLNAEMTVIDNIFAREVAKYRDAIYVPADAVLAPSGQFTPTGVNQGGQVVTTRTPDGVHITPDGGQLLASGVMTAVEHHWHFTLPG
jgi:hypothetical protein